MQPAILTRVLPATNTKPTRIVAQCDEGRLICSAYVNRSSTWAAHKEAATRLMQKLGWFTGPRREDCLVCGSHGQGYVWTWLVREDIAEGKEYAPK